MCQWLYLANVFLGFSATSTSLRGVVDSTPHYLPLHSVLRISHCIHAIHIPATAILVFSLVLFAAFTTVTSVPAIAQVFPFHRYSVEDGLISNSINTLYQDSRGYLWIGTTDGISVYDGKSFKNYTTLDGLKANFISDIIEDPVSPGTMWIATAGGGMERYSRGEFSHVDLDSALPALQVSGFLLDQSRVVWCATDSGVYKLENGSVVPFESRVNFRAMALLAVDAEGVVWLRTTEAFLSYSPTTQALATIFRYEDIGGIAHYPSVISADADGTNWVGLWDGTILKIRHGNVEQRRITGCVGMIFLFGDLDGNLWFGSYFGLFALSKKEFLTGQVVHYSTENGLPENTIRTAFVDLEGNVWVGGIGRGLAKLADRSVVKFPIEGINPPNHRSIGCADRDGRLWVVNELGDLWEFWQEAQSSNGSSIVTPWRRSVHRLRLPKNNAIPFAIASDSRGTLWVGYEFGPVASYETISRPHGPSELRLKQEFHLGGDLPEGGAICLTVDRSDCVWVSVNRQGIVLLDPSKEQSVVRIYGEAEGVPTGYVWSIYEDRTGNIWAATFRDCITKLPSGAGFGGKFRRYIAGVDFPDAKAFGFAEDTSGNVWVGTSSNGVAILSRDSVRTLSTRDGLPSNRVLSITRDLEGKMWLGTQVGAVCYDNAQSKIVLKNRELMGSAVFTSGTTSKGLLWFVTSAGLTVYSPREDTVRRVPPPVYIGRFLVGGHEMRADTVVELSHDQNNCAVEFVGLNFKDERGVQYQYKLEGADREWSAPSNSHSVSYASLRPGTYTFLVKAITASGIESALPASLTFTISPPYWRTWWFYGLEALSVVSVLLVVRKRKILQLKKETEVQREFSRRLLDSQEQERKRIAAELHDSLGQDLVIIKNRADNELQRSETPASRLDEISSVASEAIQNVREISYNLRPYQLDRMGLTRALQSITTRIAQSSAIVFSIDVQNIDGLLPRELEIHLYRIVQEAANNIIKHSGATEACFTVARTQDAITVDISDKGKGFDQAMQTGGLGLRGITERVAILSGTLSLSSSLGSGTKIVINIPIKIAAHE